MSFEGRKLKVDGMGMAPAQGYPFWLADDGPLPDGTPNPGPVGVSEKVTDGTTEEWVFGNTTADTHPLHVHLVQFGVIERLPSTWSAT